MIPSAAAATNGKSRFAVIELDNSSNTVTLTNVLNAMGYRNIEFVNSLLHHSSFNNSSFQDSALAPFDSVSSRAALDLLNGTSTLFENKDIFTIAAEKMLASNNLDNGVQNSTALDDSNDNFNSNSTFGIRKTVRRIAEPSDKRTIFNSKRPLDSDSATVGQLLTMNSQMTVTCNMCKNAIMSSRMSNLMNHVKRHSVKKQYSCLLCSAYSHNEQSKVRMHMANKHQDSTSNPIDNYCEELQKTWDLLMEKCFPSYADKISASNKPQPEQLDIPVGKKAAVVESHNCIECGEVVETLGVETGRVEEIETHLRTKHAGECAAYTCDACGYANAKEYTVRYHICRRHESERIAEITVSRVKDNRRFGLNIARFFPSLSDQFLDPEEEQMKAGISSILESSTNSISDITNTNHQTNGSSSDDKNSEESSFSCELCHTMIDLNESGVGALLTHARKHNIRLFEEHEKNGNDSDDQLRSAWFKSIQLCFPKLANLSSRM